MKKVHCQKGLKLRGQCSREKNNYNVMILLSDALRVDALSVDAKNQVVVDKSLNHFMKNPSYLTSPSLRAI